MNGVYYALVNGRDIALTDHLGSEECLKIQPQLNRLYHYDNAVIEIEKMLEVVKQSDNESGSFGTNCLEKVLGLLKGDKNESNNN